MRLYPDAVNRYIDDPTSGLNTSSSREGYRRVLRSLQLEHPDLPVAEFTEDHLVAFVGRSHLSPATRAGYRTRIHGFFSWALWKRLVTEDPSANLKRLVPGSQTKPVTEHHWLGTADVAQVFDSVDTATTQGLRLMAVLRLGFTMGLRRAEIAGLRWDQVDLDRQLVSVVGKGQKRASLYITDSTLPWFDKWRSVGPGRGPVIPRMNTTTDFRTGWVTEPVWDQHITSDMIGRIVSKASSESGTVFLAHDMRRSFANMLLERGASIEEISAALRHSNLGTTQRYLETRQDAGLQAVKKRGLDV